MSDPREHTLLELAERIRRRETSPLDIVRFLLDRIRRTEDRLKAYVTVCEESALKHAEAAEIQLRAGHDLGPLHGLPVSVKDLSRPRGFARHAAPNSCRTTSQRLIAPLSNV
jgi:Asp-tRNA(Asn)/Glu-tRNA(Gln) amidotransferase A subunit family amidase